MNERIIFLKERLGFIIDHIDLFLEGYNRLTTTYFIPKDNLCNHFDFHLISNVNPIVWENFKIDSQSFRIISNSSPNLSGLVKGKTYIVPPFIEKERLEKFFTKISNYLYLLEVDASGDEKLEQIVGELNSNQINLLLKIDGDNILLPIEQLCRNIIDYRDYSKVNELVKNGKYSSKIDLELKILNLVARDANKIEV